MCTITWLQLSDLHFGSISESISEMREKLKVNLLKYAVENQIKFDYLIIPGDIIDARCSNVAQAYKEAGEFILNIQSALSISKSNTFVVPGNHDIDLFNTSRSNSISIIRNEYHSSNGSFPNGVDTSALCPTSNFRNFFQKITRKKFQNGHTLYRKNNIDFLCIDSSYTCTESTMDFGHLILGMSEITQKIQRRNRESKMFVVSHHGIDWLCYEEKNSLISKMSSNNACVFCCGHIHEAESYITSNNLTPSSTFIVSVSPSLSSPQPESTTIGYNIGQLETEKAEDVSIISFVWNQSSHTFQQQWRYPAHGHLSKLNVSLEHLQNFRVNSIELFGYRQKRNLTQLELTEITGIPIERIRTYERLNPIYSLDSILIYPQCTASEDIIKLSLALSTSPATLIANLSYISTHKSEYNQYKKEKGEQHMPTSRAKTQVVIFDFDGTLTLNAFEKSSWERLWLACNFTVQDCQELHAKFSRGEITHQEWCNLTAQKFKEQKFSRQMLKSIAQSFELINDCAEIIKHLKDLNITLYIISGSILELIKEVLGPKLFECFSVIKANRMHFDRNDIIQSIEGTKYDFDGKGVYVRHILDTGHYTPNSVVFFGNSFNDHSVCSTGVKTVCINPKQTNPYASEYWTYNKSNVKSMREFLQFIDV